MYRFAILLLTLLLISLTGCIETGKYPAQWSKPVAKLSPDGCSGLVGMYANDRVAYPNEDPVSISYLLAPKVFLGDEKYRDTQQKILDSVEYVKFSAPHPGVLKIQGFNSDSNDVVDFEYSEEDKNLSCKSNGAVITNQQLKTEGGFVIDIMTDRHQTIMFSKNTDGDLIVRDDISALSLVNLVPIPVKATEWYRFRAE